MNIMTNKISISILFCLCASTFACKQKENPIDNSNTIKVPYVLYAGGRLGDIFKTNDAVSFDKLNWGGSTFTNSIWALDSNVLWVNSKVNVGCGTKQTEKFAYKVAPNSVSPLLKDGIISQEGYPNASYYDAVNKIFYLCALPELFENANFGEVNSFVLPIFTTSHSTITSITKTTDGNVYAFDINQKLFKRTGGVGSFTPILYDTIFPTGGGQFYFISNYNNTLILSDIEGFSGAYYSIDGGVNWSALAGCPANGRFLMGKQVAYNGNYYTSVDSLGMYRLQGTTLVKDDGGLPPNTRIWDMVGKRNVYRTDVAKYYFFLGTNKGLFRSDNNAKDWVKVYNEEFTALH
jgi:hypothetical protein